MENKKNISVSVILPVYNSGKIVEKAIQSIFQQTLKNIELILVDDGSDIETKKILDSIDHNLVRLIRKRNGGVSSARNVGIREARGEYIFFLDSDDYIDDDFLKKMYDEAVKNDLDLVCGNVVEHNSTRIDSRNNKGKKIENFISSDDNDIGKNLNSLYLWSTWAKLFKNENIKKINIFFDETMELGEDLYFTYSYLLNFSKLGFVGDSSYHIENINSNSLSKKYSKDITETLEKQVTLWTKIENKRPLLAEWYYKTHVDFRFYQVTLFIDNLYKNGANLNYKERLEKLEFFLSNHKKWIEITDEHNLPKGLKDKILYRVINKQNSYCILTIFYLKERLRRLKFSIGKGIK